MPRSTRRMVVLAALVALGMVLVVACTQHASDSGSEKVTRQGLTSVAVEADPLVRMPGTQPHDGVNLEAPGRCLNCHGGYNSQVEPGHNWKGSMMAHAARDFLFFACLTVAAQDSAWATGRPNATDICERCHFPKGWLEGRSDPTNASLMTGADFDGVQCDFCHRMYDPFFQATHDGTREGSDWAGYWDESNKSSTPSQPMADATHQEDLAQAQGVLLFNGSPFYGPQNLPVSSAYSEAGAGQYYVSTGNQKRASFADAAARHQMFYSRFHKSRNMCQSCHDVSNPVLANLSQKDTSPLDGTTVLNSEKNPAYSFFHVERTFSEFALSAYGQQGGAPGIGPFAPTVFKTSLPGNAIARCQDCHMRDVSGRGANKNGVPLRPDESTEHPKSGQPLHDMTGGNIWVSYVLASATSGSPNYDAQNAALLNQGPDKLTLDLTQGEGIDAQALLDGVERAKQQLKLAAAIEALSYDPATGALSFRVQNHTGHKLISGFPEGRRMFVNVRAYKAGTLIHEVNPYDATVGTLKGLDQAHSPESPALGQNESYDDALVYEMHPTSTVTKEQKTLHFALATGRYKDNRIPPKGFDISKAAARLAEPVWQGASKPDLYTAAEYQGGFDAIALTLPAGADKVEVNLYYQTTSREFVAFLSHEILGTTGRRTLPDAAYIAQTDPFFAKLKAWGDAVWQLWLRNKEIPGAAPYLMTQAVYGGTTGCSAPVPTLQSATPDNHQVTLAWSDLHTQEPGVTGYKVYYDQAGKSQLVTQLGQLVSYVDSGLTNGQQYCYKVTALTAACESNASQVVCATPNTQGGAQIGTGTLRPGVVQTSGKGKNTVTTFTEQQSFSLGDTVTIRATVANASTGEPVAGATVTVSLSGPQSATLTSQPSDATGVADVSWTTKAPNKRGAGGTTTGSYTVKTTDVSAQGFSWDGVQSTTGFTLQ